MKSKKDKHVATYLTQKEYELLRQRAFEYRYAISEFVRLAILVQIHQEKKA